MNDNVVDFPEKEYRMTPKGALYVIIKKQFPNSTLNNIDGIWEELTDFVSKQASHNGMGGIPCLVLVDGGYCITAGKG